MDYTPKKNILRLRPDSVEFMYNSVNMKPAEMEDAIKTFREWINKQPHFKRKDFSDHYLLATIVIGKGSVELAKQNLDKICTLRSLLPDRFRYYDVKTDFTHVFEVMKPIAWPQVTKDHCRIISSKPYLPVETCHISDALKYSVVLGDYMRQVDYIQNYIIIIDLSLMNMMDVVTKLNLMDLRDAFTVYFEGHGLKFKGLYFITTSKMVDALIGLLKQILKPKIVSRIKVFKAWDEIHDIVGKDIIPVDFGGYEKSEQEIHEDWLEELSNEDFKQYLRDINSSGTDETCRPSYKFNEDYAGIPGTFRVLSVD